MLLYLHHNLLPPLVENIVQISFSRLIEPRSFKKNKTPLLTLGNIYSTNANVAEQIPGTQNSNKHNGIKNPNWWEENQLGSYKGG